MTNSTRIRQKTFCINFFGFNLRLTRLIVLPISPVLLHIGPTFKCLYLCFRCLGTFWRCQNLRQGAAILDFMMAAICFTLLCISFPIALWKENKGSLFLRKFLLCGNCYHMAAISEFKMTATLLDMQFSTRDRCRLPCQLSLIIIIIMAGMAVFLRGWLPHRGKAQMACNYCFPTRTMF